jgi:hypothetical protein
MMKIKRFSLQPSQVMSSCLLLMLSFFYLPQFMRFLIFFRNPSILSATYINLRPTQVVASVLKPKQKIVKEQKSKQTEKIKSSVSFNKKTNTENSTKKTTKRKPSFTDDTEKVQPKKKGKQAMFAKTKPLKSILKKK